MHNPNAPSSAEREEALAAMTKDALTDLGTGSLAYIRKMHPAELKNLFPDMPPLQDNMTLWALLNADGTPILVADSREAAVANAFEHELEMVSLH